MYFCTELERQHHQIAALIPHKIWKNSDLLNQVLWPEVDECIRVFQKTGKLQVLPSDSITVRKNILTILLCITPQLSVEQLFQYVQNLSVAAPDCMELARLTERFDYVTYFFNITMLSAYDTFSTYRESCYNIFLNVCENGRLSILNQLLAWMPALEKQTMFAYYNKTAIDKAIRYGHYEVFMRLLEAASMPITQLLKINQPTHYNCIEKSVEYGQIKIL